MSGLDQARFREVLGHFATGITIVTALEDGVPVGFSCQSFAALSLDPPMVILAPARSSTSWPRIAKAGAFCVNILGGAPRGALPRLRRLGRRQVRRASAGRPASRARR